MAGAGLGDGVGDLLADSVIEVVFVNNTNIEGAFLPAVPLRHNL